MNAGMFCVWCGEMLENQDDYVVCNNCGTIFTNTTLSRIVNEGVDSIAVETTINLECITVKCKGLEKSDMIAQQRKLVSAPAMIYG